MWCRATCVRNSRSCTSRNFTDVDDKIIKRANEVGEASTAISERFIREFDYGYADYLGVLPADVHPGHPTHARNCSDRSKPLAKGVAYESHGDLYYAVKGLKAAQVWRRALDDMQAGARVDVSEQKRDPMDFALWKTAKPGEPSMTIAVGSE